VGYIEGGGELKYCIRGSVPRICTDLRGRYIGGAKAGLTVFACKKSCASMITEV